MGHRSELSPGLTLHGSGPPAPLLPHSRVPIGLGGSFAQEMWHCRGSAIFCGQFQGPGLWLSPDPLSPASKVEVTLPSKGRPGLGLDAPVVPVDCPKLHSQ